jgi:hypothetical protein
LQLGVAPLLVGGPATTHASRQRGKSRGGGSSTHKDVKNEDRSGNVYENKGSTDMMTDNYSGFCAWFASFSRKWTEIQRAFWLNTHKSDDNCGEARAQIGSSVHRPIDPSAEHGVVLRWRDDPMARCPDRLTFPLCTSKQRVLAINNENPTKIYGVENRTVR